MVLDRICGGGGSYGGRGGRGVRHTGTEWTAQSDPYGSETLSDLLGGSGGGGGRHNEDYLTGGAGGAGGGLGLFARGDIVIRGRLTANGGRGGINAGAFQARDSGGGGSGGGVLLAARHVELTGAVSSTGGKGGEQGMGGNGGGGGGGGRVAIYSQDDWGIAMQSPYTNAPARVLLTGGPRGDYQDNGSMAGDGARGTFYDGGLPYYLIPPSNLVSVLSPTNWQAFSFGDTVTITGLVQAASGTVARVDVFTNGGLLGAATLAGGSWRRLWPNVPAGTQQIVAVSANSGGDGATSTVVRIVVTGSDFDLDGIPDAIDPDDDNDGMPDEYENRYPTELNPFDATDKWEDPDRDGHANYEEYIANTIPTNAASVLHVSAVANATGGTAFMLYFGTESNRVYGVDWRTNLVWGLWRNLTNGIPGTGGTVGVRTGNTPKGSFYRLNVTLAQ